MLFFILGEKWLQNIKIFFFTNKKSHKERRRKTQGKQASKREIGLMRKEDKKENRKMKSATSPQGIPL